jgi:nucleotide-binding universal stress UspA family protein
VTTKVATIWLRPKPLIRQRSCTHILLPTDGSALSEVAIHKGTQFAKSIHAQVTGLHVILPYETHDVVALVFGGTEAEHFKLAQQQAEDYLAVIREAAQKADVPCDTTVIRASHVPGDPPNGAS